MYEDTQIHTAIKTFLRLFINNTLSWKAHAECIKSKLSLACYAMWSVRLLPLCNDLWFIVLGALLRQYKDFQVAKEDY